MKIYGELPISRLAMGHTVQDHFDHLEKYCDGVFVGARDILPDDIKSYMKNHPLTKYFYIEKADFRGRTRNQGHIRNGLVDKIIEYSKKQGGFEEDWGMFLDADESGIGQIS